MKPEEAVSWMLEELDRRKYLDQEAVAYALFKSDKSLTYHNSNGNLAIAKPVLSAFRKAAPENVVWSRSERHWRYRKKRDKPGRLQD